MVCDIHCSLLRSVFLFLFRSIWKDFDVVVVFRNWTPRNRQLFYQKNKMKSQVILFTLILLAIVFQSYSRGRESYSRGRRIAVVKSFSTLENENFCPQNSTRSDTDIDTLIKEIDKESFTEKKLELLARYINSSSLAFTGQQVNKLITHFSFTDAKTKAIAMMNAYIIGMTSDEMIQLLNSVTFSREKLQTLQAVKDTLSDAENKENIVQKAFTFSSDRNEARKILNDTVSRNCVFGTVEDKVAIFLIDLSGSMDTDFVTPAGKKYTRLEFVKEQLSLVIEEQLKPYQMFNVVGFSSNLYPWSSAGVVNATSENVASAVKYVNSLRTVGGTNLYNAIQDALSNTKIDLRGLYLLSDGLPNEGVTNVDTIISNIKTLNAQRKTPVVINTTAFLLGKSSQEEKVASAKLMRLIAEATGGVFRNMDMN